MPSPAARGASSTRGLPRPGAWNGFEAADRDARDAVLFWRTDQCPDVLPLVVIAGTSYAGIPSLPLAGLRCRTTICRTPDGRQLVRFAQDGRALQIEVHGVSIFDGARLLTDVLVSSARLRAHRRAVARLADLARYRELRPKLYPCHPRRFRLALVLQALDGALDRARPYDMAVAIYGEKRTRRDWSNAGENLRDQLRRAVKRGRFLMESGYRQFLH